MPVRTLAATAFCLAATLPAHAAFELVPPQPVEFEPLAIRGMLGACDYDPSTVSVSMAANVIRVVYRGAELCPSAPPPPTLVDLRLGTLPRGSYSVEVYRHGQPPDSNASERIAFRVAERPMPPAAPSSPFPNTDYSGMWYSPPEAGWGLSIGQNPAGGLFGAWYVFTGAGIPVWLTLQDGAWLSPTRWQGKLYGTTGPDLFEGPFDGGQVMTTVVGTASLDFTQFVAGDAGQARLEYTLGSLSGTKVIRRLAF